MKKKREEGKKKNRNPSQAGWFKYYIYAPFIYVHSREVKYDDIAKEAGKNCVQTL